MLLIKNGLVFTATSDEFTHADILIKNGKIAALASTINEEDAEIIDAAGRLVMPGLIDAHTHMGIMENEIGPAGYDNNEMGDPISPQLRGIDCINPETRSFADARKTGVTTVVTGVGSQNILGGTHVAIKTAGYRVDDMVVKNHVAMKCAFGENPKKSYGFRGIYPITRMGQVAIFRETLFRARDYLKVKEAANGDLALMPPVDLKMEGLIPVLKGEVPLKAHAHRHDDMMNAIRIAKEFDLKILFIHATAGHLIAKQLKEANILGCILGPTFSDGGKFEMKDVTFETHAILHKAGVKFAFQTDAPISPVEHLPLMAALAVRSGLGETDALKALTINAAEIYGFDDRVGSLEVGKDADILICEVSPLEFDAQAWKVLIDGKVVYSA